MVEVSECGDQVLFSNVLHIRRDADTEGAHCDPSDEASYVEAVHVWTGDK